MRKALFFLLLCCLTLTVWAQRPQKPIVINLLPEDTSENAPTLTVYLAAKPNGKAIIQCPGGGYVMLSMTHEGHNMYSWINSLGITYAVLQYRLPKGDHTIPLADAEAAITQMRAHAAEWHIDPNKIGIMGCSAGGHLASTLATHYHSPATRPDFQILFYPVITMDKDLTHSGSRQYLLGENPSEQLVQEFSNETRVNAQTPPAFILLSADDRVVPPANSINYFNALLENKVSATLHIYPYGGHGWGNLDSFKWKRAWTGELEQWLREL